MILNQCEGAGNCNTILALVQMSSTHINLITQNKMWNYKFENFCKPFLAQ